MITSFWLVGSLIVVCAAKDRVFVEEHWDGRCSAPGFEPGYAKNVSVRNLGLKDVCFLLPKMEIPIDTLDWEGRLTGGIKGEGHYFSETVGVDLKVAQIVIDGCDKYYSDKVYLTQFSDEFLGTIINDLEEDEVFNLGVCITNLDIGAGGDPKRDSQYLRPPDLDDITWCYVKEEKAKIDELERVAMNAKYNTTILVGRKMTHIGRMDRPKRVVTLCHFIIDKKDITPLRLTQPRKTTTTTTTTTAPSTTHFEVQYDDEGNKEKSTADLNGKVTVTTTVEISASQCYRQGLSVIFLTFLSMYQTLFWIV